MKKILISILLVVGLALMSSSVVVAAPGKPAFSPMVAADGEYWGTKATAEVAPHGNNAESFNKLFIILDGDPNQLPVADAGPGTPGYSPLWETWTAQWEVPYHAEFTFYEVKDAYDPVDDWQNLAFHVSLGHLTLSKGSPIGGPPDYFVCPLLPVKD